MNLSQWIHSYGCNYSPYSDNAWIFIFRPDLSHELHICISRLDMCTWVSHQQIKVSMSKTDPAIVMHTPTSPPLCFPVYPVPVMTLLPTQFPKALHIKITIDFSVSLSHISHLVLIPRCHEPIHFSLSRGFYHSSGFDYLSRPLLFLIWFSVAAS